MSDENPNPNENADMKPSGDEHLGDAGKRALDAERDARKAAEKAAKDAQSEIERMKAEAQKAKDEEAAEQGRWKELAEKRDADLTATTTKLTALESERNALSDYVKADIDAVTKAVRDAKDNPAAKALLDFHPGDDADPLTLLAWAQKAKTRLPDITTQTTNLGGGNPPNPKPSDGRVPVEDEKRARASMRPRL